jgi:hypothetical protein
LKIDFNFTIKNMRTNLKNITLVLAQFAIASTSCINTKAPMPITTFKLTKDSTMLGIWGHLERDPSEGPSDLFRGFSFVILPIYSKNDSIFVASFEGNYYDTTKTWEENGKDELLYYPKHNPADGPICGWQSSGDWQYLDGGTLVNWTLDDSDWDDYLIINADNNLEYLRKRKRKRKNSSGMLKGAIWKHYIPKHDSMGTKK